MTVADLIAELSAHQLHKTVKVVLSHFVHEDEFGDEEMSMTDQDAIEACEVRDLGSHVLIRSY